MQFLLLLVLAFALAGASPDEFCELLDAAAEGTGAAAIGASASPATPGAVVELGAGGATTV